MLLTAYITAPSASWWLGIWKLARREVAPALSQSHTSASRPTHQATQLSAALPWAGLGLR